MNDEDDTPSVPGMRELRERNLRGELHEDQVELGLVVDGTWRLIESLGHGGFSRVFKGWHVDLKAPFALKFLTSPRADDRAAFLEEARVMARIERCKHLVHVSHYGTLPGGTPYFVMECLHGKTLRERLVAERTLPLDQAIGLMEDALAGLAHVHEHGLVHSDIKPENLFLDQTGIRLLDFGLARTSSLVRPYSMGGTPPYMAPEVLLESAPPGPRSDLYAMGVVLYEMLTGHLPRGFLQMDLEQAQQEARDAPARPLQFFRPDLPEALSRRLEEIIAIDPSARPPTARAMLERLRASIEPTVAVTASKRVELQALAQDDVSLGSLTASMPPRSENRTVWGVPPPPSLFLGRDGDLCAMKERLGIGAATKPIGILASSGPTVTAMRGWAGVGKTALASVLAVDPDVATTFPGGVLWATLGPKPNLPKILATWGRELGTEGLLRKPTLSHIADSIRRVLTDGQYLLVVDDVLEKEHIEVFRRACPPGCSLLVATREIGALSHLDVGEDAVYRLPVLSIDDGVALLGTLAPDATAANPSGVRRLVQVLGCLPLALHVAGRLLREEARMGLQPSMLLELLEEEAMSSQPGVTTLLAAETPADRMDLDKQMIPSVGALLNTSTDRLSEQDRRRFAFLGPVAPRPATFDLRAIKAAWECEDPWPTIRALVARGLLEVVSDPNEHHQRFQMHSLLVMHARSLLR